MYSELIVNMENPNSEWDCIYSCWS